MTDNNQLNHLLPIIYIHIHRTVKKAIREAMAEMNQQETLDSKACADYLHVKRDALYKMVKNNELPHTRIGKRKLLFFKKDLQNYLANNISKFKKDE